MYRHLRFIKLPWSYRHWLGGLPHTQCNPGLPFFRQYVDTDYVCFIQAFCFINSSLLPPLLCTVPQQWHSIPEGRRGAIAPSPAKILWQEYPFASQTPKAPKCTCLHIKYDFKKPYQGHSLTTTNWGGLTIPDSSSSCSGDSELRTCRLGAFGHPSSPSPLPPPKKKFGLTPL